MNRRTRGSVTVFVCIILAVVVPLSMILIDLCRYRLAVKQVETALKVCGESMLAAYDRQLKEQYGLMALYPRDEASLNEEIYELLTENLNESASIIGTSDIYGFKVRSVEAIPFYNYTETFVLDQQVAEFMKYRAPVQVVQEFVEKIRVMVGLMKESDMIEKKMNLDRLMNDIRSSLVNLHFMINEKLGGLNPASGSTTLKDKTISDISKWVNEATKEMESANSEITPIAEAKSQYVSLYPGYAQARKDSDSAQSTMEAIGRDIDRIESRLAELRAQRANATGSAITAIDNSISNLESELETKKEAYTRAEAAYRTAYQYYVEKDTEISPSRNELQTRLPKVIQNLANTLARHNSITASLNALVSHLDVYIRYHKDLLTLIQELEPKLNDLDKQSQSLQAEIENESSAVSDKIKGDLTKQLQSIRKETFNELKETLSANLKQLEAWKGAITGYLTTISEASNKINAVLDKTKAFQNELHNPQKTYDGYREYDIQSGYKTLESSLSNLKAVGQMQGVYEVPDYHLEPIPNSEEKKAFNKWFKQKYEGAQAESQPTGDDKEMEQIRGSSGDFAKVVSTLSSDTEGQGEEKEEDAARVNNLPTKGGAKTSDEALGRIGKSIEASAQSQAVANPLDAPVQGVDKVNEKEKGFFSYELERITALLKTIDKALKEGIESLMESLYMNEYIVSAFKNAATGSMLEYDIGWDRPLDNTYFDKAEVEYVLFGNMSEKANVGATQRSIFAIRLVFNLLHIYTDPGKVSTALSLATALAGWTIFGVPVVQNFLLVVWAGLESYVDSEILIKGGSVPLIKTASSWYLQVSSLVELKNILLKKVSDFAVEKLENFIDDASEAIEETVTGIIDGIIDKAFSGIETAYNEVTGEVFSFTDAQIQALVGKDWIGSLRFDSLDTFKESMEQEIKNKITSIHNQIKDFVPEKLAALKKALKQKIRDWTFEHPKYKEFVEKLKQKGTDLINKGIQAASDKLDSVLGKAGGSSNNNITGRLIMMDYTDYLRLMLLAVPQETKARRVADLMQLKMQEVAENHELMLNQYNTFLYIKAEVDFKPWFLPEALFRKNGGAMISAQWSQGY